MGFSGLLRGEVKSAEGQALGGAVTGEVGYSFGVPLQKPPTLASGEESRSNLRGSESPGVFSCRLSRGTRGP